MSKVVPKKHLGQHFLKDENIAASIVKHLGASDQHTVIEVGPGMGVLTKHMLNFPGLIAMDVDADSVAYLKRNYPDHADKFVLGDFLKQSLPDEARLIKVIGNLPYNISSQIFFKIYDHRHQVDEAVVMIQKEVADRIVSKHGNKVYGILSVLLQAYYDITYLFTVKPEVFNPPPKVNSAVIRLVRNETKVLDCDEKLFKRVVKAGFGKRRKTLRNALKELNFATDHIDEKTLGSRAEQLSVQEFIDLTKQLS
ncbi:MAG: 16S rRNA (adenine1518-N6/adenine1519-N6)-dimethyltransferase [Cyclobacteriaceae bacterium]